MDKVLDQFKQIQTWTRALEGRTLSMSQLIGRTGSMLRKLGHPVMMSRCYDENLDPNHLAVSASYYWDLDEEGEDRYLEIVLTCHPDSKQAITISNYSATWLPYDIVESLCHEYRHQEQYRKRAFKQDSEYPSKHEDLALRRSQSYLGMPSEIDAFGYNIAVRLWLIYGAQALEHLKNPQSWSYEDSPDFYGYLLAFGLKHHITRKLYKKISKNLHQLVRRVDK